MFDRYGIFWLIIEKWFDDVWGITPSVIICIACLFLAVRLLSKRFGYSWMTLCLNVLIITMILPSFFHIGTTRLTIDLGERENAVVSEAEKTDFLPKETEVTFMDSAVKDTAGGKESVQQTPVNQKEHIERKGLQLPADLKFHYIWFTGMVLVLAYHLIQYIRLQLYLRRGRERVSDAAILDCYYSVFKEYQGKRGFLHYRPALYYHKGLPSSICIGVLNKTIYIDSQNRDIEEMKWILSHELVHCLRGDLVTKLGMVIMQAVHWFNPFVHLYIRQMDKMIELGCDEDVIGEFSMEEKKGYCMAILNSVREGNRKRARMSTAFVENKETLQKRLEYIIKAKPPRKGHVFLVFIFSIFLMSANVIGCAKIENQETAQQEEYLAQLYDMRASFIGDASSVGKILGLLPLPEYLTFHDEGMELFTDETAPMGVNRHLTFVGTISSEIDDSMLERNAYLFLALVNNADFVEYTIHGEENAVLATYRYDRKTAEEYYGDTDLRSFTSDIKTFCAFAEEVSQLFDCPLTEDVFVETTSSTWEEKQSQAGQYIDALAELPMEGDFTSWAEKIRQQPEFDALCKLGDDTLIYCLSNFAVYAGEDTESMVMMLAADWIAFGEREPEELAQTTPSQWYSFYNALDSVYTGPFYKGMEEQYAAMPQTTYLTLSKEAQASKVTSKDKEVQAVYAALSSIYEEDSGDGHRTTIFAPLILDISKTEDQMIVSCVVRADEFCLMRVKEKGYCMKEISGSCVPASLIFSMKEDGWALENMQWAKDGSLYESSIREVAPNSEIANKMISYDPDEMTRLLYENLISYLELVGVTKNGPYIYDSSHIEPDTKAEISRFLRMA